VDAHVRGAMVENVSTVLVLFPVELNRSYQVNQRAMYLKTSD